MPIKNYRTKVSAAQHLSKIQEALVSHGAVGMQFMYDADRRVSSVHFAVPFREGKNISFALPCEWRRFQQVLKNQNVRRWDDDEYAYRVAWANIKDWVIAQMTLYETQMVEMPQIFLPFATDSSGLTLYEKLHTSPNLLLGNNSN